jgi:hypothetical protein
LRYRRAGGAGRAPGRAVPGRLPQLCACPGRPAGPMGHPARTADGPPVPRSGIYRGRSGRRGTSGRLGLPKVSAEAGCSAQMGAVGLVRSMGPHRLRCTRPPARTRPRTAPARLHAPAAPDRLAGRPPDLRDTIHGTRSAGHDLAGRTAMDPSPSVSVMRSLSRSRACDLGALGAPRPSVLEVRDQSWARVRCRDRHGCGRRRLRRNEMKPRRNGMM